MKCSWDAERSFSSEARHLVMNSYGVMGAFSLADEDDRPPDRHPRVGLRPTVLETESGSGLGHRVDSLATLIGRVEHRR